MKRVQYPCERKWHDENGNSQTTYYNVNEALKFENMVKKRANKLDKEYKNIVKRSNNYEKTKKMIESKLQNAEKKGNDYNDWFGDIDCSPQKFRGFCQRKWKNRNGNLKINYYNANEMEKLRDKGDEKYNKIEEAYDKIIGQKKKNENKFLQIEQQQNDYLHNEELHNNFVGEYTCGPQFKNILKTHKIRKIEKEPPNFNYQEFHNII